ncbi:IS66-like element accessory protein TnpA [Acidisoma sp. S159]|uniref:IS66-like element accessory protein TnpA n=1 Tax=Acidisoma sp. S159 TaxID=1747225 RepID=UPI00131BEC83
MATLAVMEEILVAEDGTERSNDRRLSALTEEIELRVRRERHRRWRPEEKLRIVQETLRPGEVIAAVARRHGVGTGLLYTWRKEMLSTAMAGFAPVQVQRGIPPEAAAAPPIPGASVRLKPSSGRIEIEFPNGIRVRVDGAADESVLRGVLSTLGGG